MRDGGRHEAFIAHAVGRRIFGVLGAKMLETAPLRTNLAIALIPLAVAETLVWAAFYYSFPAFLPAWEASLGWSRAEISGAFTACLVLTGLLAPNAGILIDRGYSKHMFLGAIAVGALLLALLSQATELWQFWTIWLGLGIVNAACLYEACFAIVTVTVGTASRRAITIVTLWAGFAGTVSFPSAYALGEALGWRGAMLVFAGVIAFIALPLAWLGLNWLGGFREPPKSGAAVANPNGKHTILRNPVFWLIGLGFATIGIVHGMIISHIRPILDDRGVEVALAVIVASMFGPMQVLGRIIMLAIEKRVSSIGMAIICFVGIAAGLVLLALARIDPILAMIFVVPYAAAYGIVSIIRPVLTAEFLGRENFGTIAGLLALPYMLGFAIAPTLAALIWARSGYDAVIMISIVLTLSGCVAVLIGGRKAAAQGPLSK